MHRLKKKKPAMITTNTALIFFFLKPNKEVIDKKTKDFWLCVRTILCFWYCLLSYKNRNLLWSGERGWGRAKLQQKFFSLLFFFWFSSELMCNVSFKDFIYSDKQVRNVLWNHQKAPQTEGGACVGVLQSLNVYIKK